MACGKFESAKSTICYKNTFATLGARKTKSDINVMGQKVANFSVYASDVLGQI